MPMQFALHTLASSSCLISTAMLEETPFVVQNYGTFLVLEEEGQPAPVASREIRIAGVVSPIVAVIPLPASFTAGPSSATILIVEGTGSASLLSLDLSVSSPLWRRSNSNISASTVLSPMQRNSAAVHGCANGAHEFRNDICGTESVSSCCLESTFAAVLRLPSDRSNATVCVFVVEGKIGDAGTNPILSAGSTTIRANTNNNNNNITNSGSPPRTRTNTNSSSNSIPFSSSSSSLCCSLFDGRLQIDAIVPCTLAPSLVSVSAEIRDLSCFRQDSSCVLSPTASAAASPDLCFSPGSGRDSVSVMQAKWASKTMRVLLLAVDSRSTATSSSPTEDASRRRRWLVINAAQFFRASLQSAATVATTTDNDSGCGGRCWLEQGIAAESVEEEFSVFVCSSGGARVRVLASDAKTSAGPELEMIPAVEHDTAAAAAAVCKNDTAALTSGFGRVTASAVSPLGEVFLCAADENEEAGLILRRTALVSGPSSEKPLLETVAAAGAAELDSPWNTRCSALWCFGCDSDSLIVFAQLGNEMNVFRFTAETGNFAQVAAPISGGEGFCHVAAFPGCPSGCPSRRYVLVPQVHFDAAQEHQEDDDAGLLSFTSLSIASTGVESYRHIAPPQRQQEQHQQQQLPSRSSTRISTTCSASTEHAVLAHCSSGELLLLVDDSGKKSSNSDLIVVSRDDRHFTFDRIALARDESTGTGAEQQPQQQKKQDGQRNDVLHKFTVCASSLVSAGEIFIASLFVFSDSSAAALSQLRAVTDGGGGALSPVITQILPIETRPGGGGGGCCSCWAVQSLDGSVSVLHGGGAAESKTQRTVIAPPRSSLEMLRIAKRRILLRGTSVTENFLVSVEEDDDSDEGRSTVRRERVAVVPVGGDGEEEEEHALASSLMTADTAVVATAASDASCWIFCFDVSIGMLVGKLQQRTGPPSENEAAEAEAAVCGSVSETLRIPSGGPATSLLSLAVEQQQQQGTSLAMVDGAEQHQQPACCCWSEDRCLIAGILTKKNSLRRSALMVLPLSKHALRQPPQHLIELPADAGVVTCACELSVASSSSASSASASKSAHEKVGVFGTSGGSIFIVTAAATSASPSGADGPSLRIVARWTAAAANRSGATPAAAAAAAASAAVAQSSGAPPPIIAVTAGDAAVDPGLFFVSLRDRVVALHLTARATSSSSSSSTSTVSSSVVELASFSTESLLIEQQQQHQQNTGETTTTGMVVLRDVVSIDAIATSSCSHAIICGSASAGVCVLHFVASYGLQRQHQENQQQTLPRRRRGDKRAKCSLTLMCADPTPSSVLHAVWVARSYCRYPASLVYLTVDSTRNIAWARSSGKRKKKKKKKTSNREDENDDDERDFFSDFSVGNGSSSNSDDDDDDDDDDDGNRNDDNDDDVFVLSPKKKKHKKDINGSSSGGAASAGGGGGGSQIGNNNSGGGGGGGGGGAGGSSPPTTRPLDQANKPTHLETPSTVAGGAAKLPFSVAAILPFYVDAFAPVAVMPTTGGGKKNKEGSHSKATTIISPMCLNPWARCQSFATELTWQVGSGKRNSSRSSSSSSSSSHQHHHRSFLLVSPTGELTTVVTTTKPVFDVMLMMQRFLAEEFATSKGTSVSFLMPPLSMSSTQRRAPCQHFCFSSVLSWWLSSVSSSSSSAAAAAAADGDGDAVLLEAKKKQIFEKLKNNYFPMLELRNLNAVARVGCAPSSLKEESQ